MVKVAISLKHLVFNFWKYHGFCVGKYTISFRLDMLVPTFRCSYALIVFLNL